MLKQRIKESDPMIAVVKKAVVAFLVGISVLFSADTLLAQDDSTVFAFVNGGALDGVGNNAFITVDGVTITTQDVIGLDGTRASDGINNLTNIGGGGGLGINSDVSDAAVRFESGEGWEFIFNTEVELRNIELVETVADGTLTISSGSFPDIVLAGELDGENDLGSTLVPANTLVSISYSSTSPDGPRIINLAVFPTVEPDPAPAGSFFTFGNGGPLDASGIDAEQTVNGVTITTQDVIGLDGTRASDDINNETNIGSSGGLGINSAVGDTARNFDPGEGWEFTFNTNVQLQEIQLADTVAGGTLTISSDSFPDIVLAGELDGVNDLGDTMVAANTLVSISYSHTDPEAGGPRITGLMVGLIGAEDCIRGDVNGDGDVTFLDISPFISALSGMEFICEADVNGDGVVNFLDISPFITLLTGAGS